MRRKNPTFHLRFPARDISHWAARYAYTGYILKLKGYNEVGQNAAVAAFTIAPGASGKGAHTITFTTKRDGPITLMMFDVAGRRVAQVQGGYAAAGSHTLTWNGVSASGRRAPSGLYFARLSTPDGEKSGKVVHLTP